MKVAISSRSWETSCGHAAVEQPLDAGREAGDADGVVRAAFEAVGHEIGLARLLADTAGAALLQREHELFDARADVEHAGAQGAEQAFVAGHGEQIDAVGLHVDGDMAGRLCAIDAPAGCRARG